MKMPKEVTLQERNESWGKKEEQLHALKAEKIHELKKTSQKTIFSIFTNSENTGGTITQWMTNS